MVVSAEEAKLLRICVDAERAVSPDAFQEVMDTLERGTELVSTYVQSLKDFRREIDCAGIQAQIADELGAVWANQQVSDEESNYYFELAAPYRAVSDAPEINQCVHLCAAILASTAFCREKIQELHPEITGHTLIPVPPQTDDIV